MFLSIGMLKQKYFLADIFILSAEKQPIKLSWRKIECLPEESIEITAQESLFLNAKKLFINIEDTISQYSKQLKTIVEENVTMQIGNELRTSMSCLDTAIQKNANIQICGKCSQVSGDLDMISSGDVIIQADGKSLLKGASEARICEG